MNDRQYVNDKEQQRTSILKGVVFN